MADAEGVGTRLTATIECDVAEPGERLRILRNVVALSIAVMLHFTAIFASGNLQSSINAALGQQTLATSYASLIVGTIFLPVIVIRLLGCKWTVAVSFLMYVPMILAQYHPQVYTLLPGAVACGFGGGPLWCAACTYLSIIAGAYSKITKIPTDVLVVRFFAIFFMIMQCSQILGNFITSAVLSYGIVNSKPDNVSDSTVAIFGNCGANNCPSDMTMEMLLPPSQDRISIIASIHLGCIACAVAIVVIFVDPLSRYDTIRKGGGDILGGFKLLAMAIKLLKDVRQVLLLPITMWMGLSPLFLVADFTASYVTCSLGVQYVGYVMICYGVMTSISSMTTGWLVKFTGRRVVICCAAVLHLGIILFLLHWVPSVSKYEMYKFFIITGLWGIADGVWSVQINAICGISFPGQEEAAYSMVRLWESTGSAIGLSYSAYLCITVKLYLAMAVMLVGVGGYLTVEYLRKPQRLRNEY